MFTKLLVVIVALILTAAALLVIRQQRLDLAHRASIIHRQLIELEPTRWALQSEIATRCRPMDVRVALENLEEQWEPIPGRVPAPGVAVAGAAAAAPLHVPLETSERTIDHGGG